MSDASDIRGPIGERIERSKIRQLAAGRGRYTDDLSLPRMVHAAFVRSSHAHARIIAVDTGAAAAAPGVVRVFTAEEINAAVEPWSGEAAHLAKLRSPPQYPMANGRALWQGEPVALVVAESRAPMHGRLICAAKPIRSIGVQSFHWPKALSSAIDS